MVVCGYGWCGRGVAMRAKGMGAQVIVTEVEPVTRPGSRHGRLPGDAAAEAAKIGDIFITVTGDKNVIDKAHFEVMKDGAILANSGHFNVEINIPALESLCQEQAHHPPFRREYTLKDGRRVYLLGEGG